MLNFKKLVVLSIGCMSFSLAAASSATSAEAFQYAITPTGIQYISQTSDSWILPENSFQTCSTERQALNDPSGGKGIQTKACWSHRAPIERRWVKTYAVDADKWSSCQIEDIVNRKLVMICPRVYSNKF